MSNTYTKIYLHIIFAVKNRESLMPLLVQQQVHLYMSSVLRNFGHLPIAIGGIENHIHLLIDYNPSQSIPEMIRELKTSTTKMINNNHLISFQFGWQRGYSAFSYAPSQIDTVKRYINNQAQHHKKVNLRQEIENCYKRFGVQYDSKYIFEEISWKE